MLNVVTPFVAVTACPAITSVFRPNRRGADNAVQCVARPDHKHKRRTGRDGNETPSMWQWLNSSTTGTTMMPQAFSQSAQVRSSVIINR